MDRNNPFGMPPMMGGDGMPRPMMPPHGGMPPMGMMPQMPLGGFQPQNIPQMDPNAGQPPLSQNANSRTVFVGNIPYDAEDSQLKSLLKLTETCQRNGIKPKGYGFCEYKDMDIASSALRNLNQYELNGRQLRVDFASDNKNGTNLKDEEVKYRDISDVYNSETGELYQITDLSTVGDLSKNLSIGQKEYM